MTSGSCSTTITVLPLSRNFSSSSFKRWTSRGCKPTLGSSKIYMTSTRLPLRCLTILTRCDSPPDSVSVARSRLRYSRPISTRCRSRWVNVRTSGTATGSVIPLTTSKSSSTSIAAMSAIVSPLILQLKAAWLSRAPLQSGQGPSFKKGSTCCRRRVESVWMSARFAVEKQVQFLWCILGDLLVVVEEARTPIQIAFPVSKSWGDDSTFIQRPGCINQCFRGNADLTAQAITLRTHALGIVEGKCICRAHGGFHDARKEQAQHRRDVSHRAHRRVRSSTQAFLINKHRHAQVLNRIGVWLRIARQQVTNEQAKILEQQSLCFVGNGVKHH